MRIDSTEIHSDSVFFIAEAGSNHNGDLEYAKGLVSAAAEAGADAVKFQNFVPEELLSGSTEEIENLRELALSREEMETLQKHVQSLDISLLSTPFDQTSATLLDELGLPAIKIGSGDLNNYPLLEHVAAFDRPMIVSTGMATIEEIETAEKRIRAVNPEIDLAFLHCVSAYPTDIEDLNLRMIADIDAHVEGAVGFSDHSLATETTGLAIAMGATIVEKHFTLSRRLSVPDAEVSLEPDELSRAVEIARNAARAKGDSDKRPIDAELDNQREFRKSVHATTEIAANSPISKEDISLLRPADGLPPEMLDSVVGKEATVSLSAGDPIKRKNLNIE
ncbi:N-acetylneuraminate synthase family protein [Halosimplex pelagicum]|uniref:N-acetylneuraminate synthase family protein n=2 Tax=Halosimplex pelagicum TaxID=869886 RepID=A0A7D5PEQ2_9EURY|nr:N-acetylneuraminate synthase family protein [Halosimplex pelagicum]